jgi:hypothetical protein
MENPTNKITETKVPEVEQGNKQEQKVEKENKKEQDINQKSLVKVIIPENTRLSTSSPDGRNTIFRLVKQTETGLTLGLKIKIGNNNFLLSDGETNFKEGNKIVECSFNIKLSKDTCILMNGIPIKLGADQIFTVYKENEIPIILPTNTKLGQDNSDVSFCVPNNAEAIAILRLNR